MIYPMGGVGVVEARNPLLVGLYGYWKFDETTGTTAVDSSGNGRNGSNSNITINQTGQIGRAYSFNGSSSVSTVSGVAMGTGNFTIAAWIKSTNTQAYKAIFSCGSYAPAFYVTYGDGLLLYHSSDILSATGLNIRNGNWHHVAVVRTGTGANQLLFYHNGSAAGTRQYSNSSSATTWYLGSSNYSGENFNGLIDDLRFYSRALSASEISALAAM